MSKDEFGCPIPDFDPETGDYPRWKKRGPAMVSLNKPSKIKKGCNLILQIKGKGQDNS